MFCAFLHGYELIHHRVTQNLTEFNLKSELREILCNSVVNNSFLFCLEAKKSFFYLPPSYSTNNLIYLET